MHLWERACSSQGDRLQRPSKKVRCLQDAPRCTPLCTSRVSLLSRGPAPPHPLLPQVPKGLDRGIRKVSLSQRASLVCSPTYAAHPQPGAAQAPPGVPVVFEVELLEIASWSQIGKEVRARGARAWARVWVLGSMEWLLGSSDPLAAAPHRQLTAGPFGGDCGFVGLAGGGGLAGAPPAAPLRLQRSRCAAPALCLFSATDPGALCCPPACPWLGRRSAACAWRGPTPVCPLSRRAPAALARWRRCSLTRRPLSLRSGELRSHAPPDAGLAQGSVVRASLSPLRSRGGPCAPRHQGRERASAGAIRAARARPPA